MNESKLDISNRLRREGTWPEASLFKDEKIREFRAAGMHRQEAQVKAWEAMAAKFPPIETPEEDEPDQDLEFSADEIAGLPNGSLEDFFTDADWVYGNLERGEVDPAAAPSSGALALLKWARRNKNDFFARIVPRAMAAPNPRRESKAIAAAEHRRINRLEDVLGYKKPKRLEDVLGLEKPEPRKD